MRMYNIFISIGIDWQHIGAHYSHLHQRRLGPKKCRSFDVFHVLNFLVYICVCIIGWPPCPISALDLGFPGLKREWRPDRGI